MNAGIRIFIRAFLTVALVFSLAVEVNAAPIPGMRDSSSNLLREPTQLSAELTSASVISVGGSHTCAVTDSGGVKCWGFNGSGRLGDGTTINRSTPVDVSGLSSGISAVSAGVNHTCALTTSGGVKCWGSNTYGQLGDGTTINRSTPVDVLGLTSGVSAISAGYWYTCAVTNSGGVKCWGENEFGKLGDGTTTIRTTPVNVSGLTSGISAVSAGDWHTCALTASGGIKCWGYNYSGQLGDGTDTNRSTPVDVQGFTSGASAVSARSEHTCAVTVLGGVKCWGLNNSGQLGDGTTNTRFTPMDVSGLTSGISKVSVGSNYTCALTVSSGVKCWGSNYWGQLGNGTTTSHSTPMDVSDLTGGISAVSAGHTLTCALTTSGGVKCWGWNGYGQLGDGTNTFIQSTPVEVIGLTCSASTVSVGYNHTCAVMTAGEAKCWGYNWQGQLGDGTTTNRSTPVDVIGLASGVSAVTTGGSHTCALTTSGGIKCWGDNWHGQLGDGTTTSRSTPMDVNGLTSGINAISAGWGHTCALTNSGGAMCWGANGSGQLGNGWNIDSLFPIFPGGLTSGVSAVSAGGGHTCAVTASGGVKCWGRNDYGQLGDGTTTSRYSPIDVSGLASGISAVTAGDSHTCALTVSGGVKCWGANEFGQLGDGSVTNYSTPVDVSGLTSDVAAVSAGGGHTCALTTAGGVKCWGKNIYGQLGDETSTSRTTPVDVSGLSSGIIAVSASEKHTCVLSTSGGIKCWGYNEHGQLGWKQLWVPVDVIGFGGGGEIYKVMLPLIQR